MFGRKDRSSSRCIPSALPTAKKMISTAWGQCVTQDRWASGVAMRQVRFTERMRFQKGRNETRCFRNRASEKWFSLCRGLAASGRGSFRTGSGWCGSAGAADHDFLGFRSAGARQVGPGDVGAHPDLAWRGRCRGGLCRSWREWRFPLVCFGFLSAAPAWLLGLWGSVCPQVSSPLAGKRRCDNGSRGLGLYATV